MLIKCTECGKEISSQAEICPNCGYRINKIESENTEFKKTSISKIGAILYIIANALLVLFAIVVILMPKDNSDIGTTDTSTSLLIYIMIVAVIPLINIILGISYLIKKHPEKYHILYGIVMLINSIILAIMILSTPNCCIQVLFVSPICCFIGSILILLDKSKENKNETKKHSK